MIILFGKQEVHISWLCSICGYFRGFGGNNKSRPSSLCLFYLAGKGTCLSYLRINTSSYTRRKSSRISSGVLGGLRKTECKSLGFDGAWMLSLCRRRFTTTSTSPLRSVPSFWLFVYMKKCPTLSRGGKEKFNVNVNKNLTIFIIFPRDKHKS